MKQRRIRWEHIVYAAAFLIALALRFSAIGSVPVTDREAELALQALSIATGQDAQLGPQPAYLILTSLLFFISDATNWTARFFPALTGSLLVLLPAFFRRRFGRVPGVLLAFLLALNPALIAASRQAGSVMLAIFFVVLAAALWYSRRQILAGVAFGLALLGGPAVWPGLLALGAALLLVGRFELPNPFRHPEEPPAVQFSAAAPVVQSSTKDVQSAAWAALITLLVLGSLFMAVPQGLSAAAGSIPAYLSGWLVPTGAPLIVVLLALLLYQLFAIVFGLWGAAAGLLREDRLDLFLLVWFAVALVLALAYPSRQPVDTAWPVVPLLALAARQAARLARVPSIDRTPSLGQSILVALIIGFATMTLHAMTNNPGSADGEYIVRLVGSILMLIASAVLISWGWSRDVALRGITWGLGAILFLYMVSGAWHSAGMASAHNRELWENEIRLPAGNLLQSTISDLDQWAPRSSGNVNVVVSGVSSPSLRWALRNVKRLAYSSHPPVEESPAVVITRQDPDIPLSAAYRGQDFLLEENIGWEFLRLGEWVRWLAFRTVPPEIILQERIILWARADLFPGFEQVSENNQAVP